MAYVVKPFSPADLIPAVEIALSRHAEIESLEDQIADLSDRFETRKRVDRAKGAAHGAHGAERAGGLPLAAEGPP